MFSHLQIDVFNQVNMGYKRNRRSRRLETPSPEREVNITQLETPYTGNETLTNLNVNVQGHLGDNNSENQIAEPSQTSNEIQVWTQKFRTIQV